MNLQRNRRSRAAITLLDTILATIFMASILVPTLHMSSLGMEQQLRSNVLEEMAQQGEATIDAIRSSVANPTVFAAAANGTLPSGIRSDSTISFLPGETIRRRVSIASYDAQKDLITVTVVLEHMSNGLRKVNPPMQFVTQIAEPW